MDSLGRPGLLAAALGAVAVVVVLVAVVAAVVAVRRSRRAARLREEQLLSELAASRAAMTTLHQRVDELSDEVDAARQAAELDHEYVITTLGDPDDAPAQVARLVDAPARPAVADLLQEQLVGVLARQQERSSVRSRVVDVVVRTVAVGHGVRRALAPDVLDRAAAEAHVARRRSRRLRKREEREARRLLKAARAQSRGHAA